VRRLPSSAADAASIAALLLLSGLGSLWLGQDVSGDLRLYHFYLGFSWWEGRLGEDIAPGGQATFFNPLLDALHYAGMAHLPARLYAFLMGALHGLAPVLVYLLMRRAAAAPRRAALAAALLAGLGPDAVMLLGSSSGDALAAIPLLAALVLLADRDGASAGRALAAGALAGLAAGLKLTMVPYGAALGLAMLIVAGDRRVARGAAYAAGCVAGFLAVAASWGLQLWRLLGNPLFPFANQLFRSPYLEEAWIRDGRWQAQGVAGYLSPPFDLAFGVSGHVQEFPFREARFAVIAVLALAWLGRAALARRRGRPRPAGAPAERLVLAFFGLAFLAWLTLFYYYRYMLSLELLAPAVLYLVLGRALGVPEHRRAALYLAAAAAIVLWSRYEPRVWGRGPYRDGGFAVRVPALGQQAGALVFMKETHASFVIPYFPRDARFVNLEHRGLGRFDALIASRLARHQGPLLFLRRPGERVSLRAWGLEPPHDCEPLPTGVTRFQLCRITRTDDAVPR
jgi:hypothetical protein